MVSKCANPECSAQFRYFHTGKLFRLETATGLERRRSMGPDGDHARALRHLEFYWLCEECAPKMTIVFERDSGVKVRDKVPTKSYACSAAA